MATTLDDTNKSILFEKFKIQELDLLTTYQISMDTENDKMADAIEWLENLSEEGAFDIVNEYFPNEVVPMSKETYEQIEARLIQEATEKAKAEAKAAWAEKQKYADIIEFAEKHGGLNKTIALLHEAFGKSGKVAKSTGKQTRTTITPEIEAKIAKLLKEGKTANEVAGIVGVSGGTVNLHKKKLGLTKPRK